MTKIKTMNLLVQKIQMKECNDWSAPELDNIEPGLYLCETPDGGMFLMIKILGDARYGFWLPFSEIGEICAREAEQKVFEQIKPIFEKGLEDIENNLKRVETITNNSDSAINDVGENLESKLVIIAKRLDDAINLISERLKHSEQQKSTLAEMSDAVVNIIKATK